VKSKFEEILRERANAFTANLAVMVNNNAALSKCDPMSVISAAVVAASLDLPIDPNLGFAHIVPYGDKAQFQIGVKGFIQLAMRSGQYSRIGVTEIYEGQLLDENPLTGEYTFDFKAKKSETIIGWAAYFKTVNGFEKTLYWPVEKIKKHGLRFSQTFKKGFGLWKDDFDSMAAKTVLKALLSKWGILSTEMQNAVKFDQGVVKSVETQEVEYLDNDPIAAAFDDGPVKGKKVTTEKLELK
ncbi:MAG TPA: recombinase RecT, partial [Flexilinea sp.]|nr:recombinase RecT [Flexilinea sp.]